MIYRLSPAAFDDLAAIEEYVGQHNPPAAVRLVDDFERRWNLLATQPRSGRPRDDVLVGLRSVVMGSYIAFYYIEAESLIIARVLHGHRDIQPEDFQP
jgi:toxin ParE1/3/4